MDFYHSDLFAYLVLPLLIFFSRITDVTIGTIRIVMVAKGQKKIAPILGFFEVLIWLIAISQIIQHLDNWICYFGYGAGFATGNYIGMIIEEKLSNYNPNAFYSIADVKFVNKGLYSSINPMQYWRKGK